ncbi:MAG TPA: ribonuclease P protein component [Nevskiaceae bacterium]|nr:ribonuclease P protein component [Nevskiaceae bacterium]
MLPKQHRLPLRKEFNRVKKQGQLFQGNLFSLLVASQASPEIRFAFIVSKKIHKKAVKRNKIRRILAESVQAFLLEIKPGVDAVFLTKKVIIDKNFTEIKKEVKRIFKKASLLK